MGYDLNEQETPAAAEQARQVDYQFRLLDRLFLVGAVTYWLVAAILIVMNVPLVIAILFGVVGTVAFLGLRRYFGGIRRRRLGEFINPYTGELTVPGGPKPLRWIALFRRS
jgi:O-antigen/teichoic acid export membrane protein